MANRIIVRIQHSKNGSLFLNPFIIALLLSIVALSSKAVKKTSITNSDSPITVAERRVHLLSSKKKAPKRDVIPLGGF